jgi:hypothetical protein
MIDLELSSISRRIVNELADVSAGEEVVVISDPEKVTVGGGSRARHGLSTRTPPSQ